MFGIHMNELDGARIHRLENILTLSPSLHDFFDQLALWLEAVVFNMVSWLQYFS